MAGPSVHFLGPVPDERRAGRVPAARGVILAGEEDFGIVPLEAQACGRPAVALRRGGALETVREGDTGLFFDEPTPESLASAIARLDTMSFDPRLARAHAERFSAERHRRHASGVGGDIGAAGGHAVVRRYNRLLVAFYVFTDVLLATWAFILAYAIRFESGLIPVTKGYPPLDQYLQVVPFVTVLTPLAFHLQGVYRLRRGRSRVDDFFAVFIGSILAVVLCVVSTLYVQAYFASDATRTSGTYQVSQLVWAIFLFLTVCFSYASREGVRELLERRWRAGIGLKRILIAGTGDLARQVAERMLQHRELGYQVVGFVDDSAGGDHLGYRGLPLLGALKDVVDIASASASITCMWPCPSTSTPSSWS